MRRWLALLFVCLVAVGCAYVPANVAADYQQIDKNIQRLMPDYEKSISAQLKRAQASQAAAVASGQNTAEIDSRIAHLKHQLLLAETTRQASTSMNTWCMDHTHADQVAAINSQRIVAAQPPATTGQ